jgi:hypothetical protein
MMKENMISTQWTMMHKDKGDLIDRCETYAKWTLDAICPEEGVDKTEYVSSYVLIGPRLVNTLSNKVVESMFPHSRAFFAVGLGAEVEAELLQEAGEEALAAAMEDIRKESRSIEKRGMAMLDVVAYRPVAVQAAQHIIITGNACIRRMDDNTRVVYGIKDFSVRRKINGDPMEAILRDNVLVSELSPKLQELVRVKKQKDTNTTVDDMHCTLYTKFIEKKVNDKVVWEEYQEVEGVPVNDGKKLKQYSEVDMPLIFPVWSLSRGEHYARGLVEEHAKIFHNLDRTTESLFDIFEIVADIKFLVRPDSIIDIVTLNDGKRGSYHQGNKDDVSVPELNKISDLQIMLQAAERMERELAAAFLLTAAGIRDAERVTAYEVREIALELETAYGGLYSKLALAWQRKEAEWVVSKLGVATIGKDKLFQVTITTGMESLSKEGELQNFREALSDLQLFEGVPEDMRSGINPLKVAKFLFGQRNVKFEEFMYTAEEQKQMQQAQEQQVQQQQQHEVAQKAATAQ